MDRWREVKTKCEGTEEIDKDRFSTLTEGETKRKLQRELEHELSTYGLTDFPL